MMTTTSTPEPIQTTSELLPETLAQSTNDIQTERRLFHYRVRVKKQTSSGFEVDDYFVQAPTQCSATRYTALRDEVDDILLVEAWTYPLPKPLTFSTDKDCP